MAPTKAGLSSRQTPIFDESEMDDMPVADPSGLTIRDLLSYRIHYTANAMSRSAMIRFRDDFGISLGEWRTIALLGALPGMSLNELAKKANIDKGQMSRIVSSLTKAGYVGRDDIARAGRTIALSLTRRGQVLYKQLIDVASEREEAFMACLTEDEKRHLYSALAKLNVLARALYSSSSKAPAQAKAVKSRRKAAPDD